MFWRWLEQCPERPKGSYHVQSKGYCLFCGANPAADWPTRSEIASITGATIRQIRERE